MKIMCISDIHGNIECLNKAIERYREENADKLNLPEDCGEIFLSDIELKSLDGDVIKKINII